MIFSCCWEVAAVTFSTSPPMLTSTVRPVREAHPRTAATTVRSPFLVPNWTRSQPTSVPSSPLAPFQGRPGGERSDRGRIHAKQLGLQPCGQVGQLLRVAVRHRQYLHDQSVQHDPPRSVGPNPTIYARRASETSATHLFR